MRLIDADSVFCRYYGEFEKQGICDGAQDRDWIKKCVEEAETVDAVPVVRCRECRHWTGVSLGMRCKFYSFPPNFWICTGPEDFCSRGEKPETRK